MIIQKICCPGNFAYKQASQLPLKHLIIDSAHYWQTFGRRSCFSFPSTPHLYFDSKGNYTQHYNLRCFTYFFSSICYRNILPKQLPSVHFVGIAQPLRWCWERYWGSTKLVFHSYRLHHCALYRDSQPNLFLEFTLKREVTIIVMLPMLWLVRTSTKYRRDLEWEACHLSILTNFFHEILSWEQLGDFGWYSTQTFYDLGFHLIITQEGGKTQKAY